jgi:hypothetical protein
MRQALGKHEVHCSALLVDGAVQIHPLALHFHISLIDVPFQADRALARVESGKELGEYFTTQWWMVEWSNGKSRSPIISSRSRRLRA